MTTETSAADHSGQDVYVGIDTHRKSWSVCIIANADEQKVFPQDPSPAVLLRHLSRRFPGARYHLAYEAGFAGNWIARAFAEQGVDCIVLHAADIPTNDKERRRKTDARDCRKIARSLCSGSVMPLYIPAQ